MIGFVLRWRRSRIAEKLYTLLRHYWWVGLLGGLFVIFYLIGVNRLDPDFGWHYMMGKYVTEQGRLPVTDPFSYTMSSFHPVDHEWLSSVLMFHIYNSFGMPGLAGIYALIVVFVFVVLVPRDRRIWALPVVCMTTAIFVLRGGVRPQVEMWLLFAVVLRILMSKDWDRWRWWLVPLLWVWANLHGSFGVALGSILVWIVLRVWKSKRLDIKDILVFMLSVLVTFINPYGWRVWYEVWMTVSDRSLASRIMEWRHFYHNLELALFFIALIWASFAYQNRERIDTQGSLLGILTFVASLSSLRHASLFAIAAMAYLPGVLQSFFGNLKNDIVTQHRARIFYGVICLTTGLVGFWGVVMVLWGAVHGTMSEEKFYPHKAVAYLRTQALTGNYFSVYDWGGYLIWRYPEKKVFIDGRMPSWRRGLWPLTDSAPDGESNYAFNDYDEILGKERTQELFDKYGITTVLWRKDAPEEEWDKKAENLLISLGLRKEKSELEKKSFLQVVEELGWKKVYEDDLAVVYFRR